MLILAQSSLPNTITILKCNLNLISWSYFRFVVILVKISCNRMVRCQLVCLCPGDSCVGHDFSPVALTGSGCWGEPTVSASSPWGTDSVAHLPAEPGAALGDGRLSGSTPTPFAMSTGWIGRWHTSEKKKMESSVFSSVPHNLPTLVFFLSEVATAPLFSCLIWAWTNIWDPWLPDLCQTVSTL